MKVFTCVPHILHPHIGAGSKKQPLHWDEEKADDVRGKRHTHKEHREGLLRREEVVMMTKKNFGTNQIKLKGHPHTS